MPIEGSWVQQTAYGIVLYVVRQLTGEWSNQLWQWFSNFFAVPVAVLSDPLVQQIVRLGVAVVLAGLPAAVAWLALRESLARMDGTSVSPPEALLRRVLITGAAVCSTTLVAWFMVQLAEYSRGVLAAVGLDINLLQQFFQMPPEAASTVLSLLLAFLVGALLLTIQRSVITAEFTVLLMIGPLMAAGLLREGGNTTWNTWLRELVSLLVTPLIQMLVLLIFLRQWGNAQGLLETGDRLASLALLYLLWKTPSWARHLTYSVGSTGDMAGLAVGAGRFMVMRHLLRSTLRV